MLKFNIKLYIIFYRAGHQNQALCMVGKGSTIEFYFEGIMKSGSLLNQGLTNCLDYPMEWT